MEKVNSYLQNDHQSASAFTVIRRKRKYDDDDDDDNNNNNNNNNPNQGPDRLQQ
jgi:hypothetical protein